MKDKEDTPWLSAGTFAGTRAQSRPILAFAIRLSGVNAEKYEVVYQARTEKENWLAPCKNGERTKADNQAITGLKIWLYKKLR